MQRFQRGCCCLTPVRARWHAARHLSPWLSAQVGAPVVEWYRGEETVRGAEEPRLADVDRLRGRRAGVLQERGPREVGRERVGGGEGQLVVVGVRVAPLDARERGARQSRLERQDTLRRLVGCGGRVAQEPEGA